MAVDPRLELKKSDHIVDVRTPTEKLAALTLNADLSRIFPFVLLFVVMFAVPAYTLELCLLLALYYAAMAYVQFREYKLPFEFPLSQRVVIKKEKGSDGKTKEVFGSGIYYLGNKVNHSTNQPEDEVWISNDMARTHMLVMGTTGSGKSEFLKSLVFNAIAQGSGFIYIDGKADASLYYSLYSAIRAAHREDDVLLINFQTGGKDVYGPQSSKLSNNLNIFANGSSGMITETLRSIVTSGDKKDVWTARANDLIGALTRPLVFLRDQHGLPLDIGVYREYLTLDKLEELVWSMPSKYPGLRKFKQVDQLESFLRSLSGYKDENVGKQETTVHEQFGYVNMQLTAVVNAFADSYGYIMKTSTPEIDFTDVLMRRRILIVLLPALEKSPDELSNLGKIVVACVKATMAKGLGNLVEGDKALVLDNRPTKSLTPFPAVLDEYGYYAVNGFAVVCAQARSLGFMACPAGQDIPAFEKGSKEESKSMLGNTNVKLCGKITCDTTTKYFTDMGGKAYYAKMTSIELDTSSVFNKFVFPKNASYESSDRVSASDLQKQTNGEWHVYYSSKVVRMNGFWTNATLTAKSHVNHFVPARRPSDEQVAQFRGAISRLKSAIFNPKSSMLGAVEFSGAVSNPLRFKGIATSFEQFEKLPTLAQGAMLSGLMLNNRMERDAAYYQALQTPGASGRRPVSSAAGVESPIFELPGRRVQNQPENQAGRESQEPSFTANAGASGVGGIDLVSEALSPSKIETVGLDGLDSFEEAASTPDFDFSPPPEFDSADLPSDFDLPTSEHPGDTASTLEEGVAPPQFADDEDFSALDDMPLSAEPDFTSADSYQSERDQRLDRDDIMTSFGSETPPPPDDFFDIDMPPAVETFDQSEGGEGLLSRDALISGVREIEARLGASDSDAGMTAMSTAQDIAYSTAYPITPPSKGVNISDLMGITQRIVGLLQQADTKME